MKIKNMKKNRRKHFFLLIGLSSMVVFGSIFIYNLVSVFIVDKITKEHFLEQCTSEKGQEALLWLLDNMKDQYSYNDSISQCYLCHIKKNKELDLKHMWLKFNAQNTEEPQLTLDINNIEPSLLIQEVREALKTWTESPWHGDISFNVFCKYILPYKIDKEPFVSWRKYYWDKYSFLLIDSLDKESTFRKIYEFEKNNFPVIDTYFPYEQDPILLDNLHGGNCRQRAFHMAYVMRALGLPVAVDYTPIWANYGENGHYWVSLINRDEKVTLFYNYIDGAYERSNINYKDANFTSSIDSLKKISKIYRLSFEEVKDTWKHDDEIQYDYLNNNHIYDVTAHYGGITTNNLVNVSSDLFSNLFVCTYSQKTGWTPVGKAKRLDAKTIDVGPLYNDNIIIVSEYKGGSFIPISSPFWIRHDKAPYKIEPDLYHRKELKLHRKYLLRTTWINRWAEVIGTKIETSNKEDFSNKCSTIFTIDKLPQTETLTIPIEGIVKEYIRIIPKENIYPVFAELQLLDKNNKDIDHSLYDIYAIGEGLTGDTIVTRKLEDGNLATTFYKRFPFWIGFKIEGIKDRLGKMRIVMWNDENQIQKNHVYELFYFYNKKWCSVGKKKATTNYITYKNVPRNALLLLRDYSNGKEERIFIYDNDKQIWF